LFLDCCDNSLKEMEAVTMCPICYQDFNEPVLIPSCQHVFCLRCIANMWKFQGSGCPDFITCPICRGTYTFRAGCADLPVSRISKRLQDIKARMKGRCERFIVPIQFVCASCICLHAQNLC